MSSPELENLVRLGQLKREPPVASEIGASCVRVRLDSRTHGTPICLWTAASTWPTTRAMRWLSLRFGSAATVRRIAFWSSGIDSHSGVPPATWRVLSKGHESRNMAEYEGTVDLDEGFVGDLIKAADAVRLAQQAAGIPQ
jgi:hypothetical protein